MRLVSACLLGIDCRYDGQNRLNEKVMQLMRDRSQKVHLIFGDNALITPKAESLGS